MEILLRHMLYAQGAELLEKVFRPRVACHVSDLHVLLACCPFAQATCTAWDGSRLKRLHCDRLQSLSRAGIAMIL